MWKLERQYSVNFLPPRARDGTHGWIVAFGVCLVFIFNIALVPTFNIIFQPIFVLADTESVAIATHVFEILTNLIVLTTGFLLKDLSAKHFVIIGSSLVFLGLLMTSLIDSLGELLLTYSSLIGIGLGLLNPASFIAILSCFNKSSHRAIGLAFASMKLGQTFLPVLAKVLLEHVQFRLVIVCMASLSFVGLLGGTCLPLIKWRSHCERDEEQQPLMTTKPSSSSMHREITRATDLDLLSDYKYLIISVGLAIVFATSTDFTKIFATFLMERQAMNINQSRVCMNVINLSDVISRATFAFATDALRLSSKTVFLIGLVGISIFRVVLLYVNLQFHAILILCMLFGACRGLTVVNQVLIIVDFCKARCPRKLPGTLGLSYVIKSLFLALFAFIFQSIDGAYSTHIYSHLLLHFIIFIIWSCCEF